MRSTSSQAMSGFATVVVILGLASCGDSSMKMDGNVTMAGKMDGNLNGSMRLEGPIQIQMAGPSVTYEGTYVSQPMFDRVKVGVTTGEWLLAVFGPTSAQTPLSTGTELWRWTCQPASEQISFLTVLSVGGDKEPSMRRSLAIVELRDGVVIDKWRE